MFPLLKQKGKRVWECDSGVEPFLSMWKASVHPMQHTNTETNRNRALKEVDLIGEEFKPKEAVYSTKEPTQ